MFKCLHTKLKSGCVCSLNIKIPKHRLPLNNIILQLFLNFHFTFIVFCHKSPLGMGVCVSKTMLLRVKTTNQKFYRKKLKCLCDKQCFKWFHPFDFFCWFCLVGLVGLTHWLGFWYFYYLFLANKRYKC